MAEVQASPSAPGQVIVRFKPEANIQTNGLSALQSPSSDVSSIQELLKRHNARCEPLFGSTPEIVQRRQTEALDAATAGGLYQDRKHPLADVPDLSCFYQIQGAEGDATKLVEALSKEPNVDAAYTKPPTYLPVAFQTGSAPAEPAAASTTGRFTDRQIYLNPAPAGIDAKIGWVLPGGNGAFTRVIDLEAGWNLTHEDLTENQGGVVYGTSRTYVDDSANDAAAINASVNHGTAVFGEISGDSGDFGVTGIAPAGLINAASWSAGDTANAIRAAADKLSPGEILLLSGQRPGPQAPNPPRGQLGFIPVEWWPDDLAAVRYAVAKGIIVVSAGGNGDANLDDPIFDRPPPGQTFPEEWRNPFNINNAPSGSILVGAGQPPPGTHGVEIEPDRSRCHYPLWGSNYARRIDCQGWGLQVTTTGYGDLQTNASRNLWYTDTFNGTSSASPIVVGALLQVQGILKQRGRRPLKPLEARLLLRTHSGSRQQDGTGNAISQRIGKRPNVRKMIPAAAGWKSRSGKFDASGQASLLVTSNTGVGLLRATGHIMHCPYKIPNNTMLPGGWRLNSDVNVLGPVGNFNSAAQVESLVVSRWGIGLLRGSSGTSLETSWLAPNGTRLGDWLLDTTDNNFGPAADFDGNGLTDLLVTSNWGMGVLQTSNGALRPIMMAPNGTTFSGPAGGWGYNNARDDLSCVGRFNAANKAKSQILASSQWGIAVLELNPSTRTFDVLALSHNGDRLGGGGWTLNTATDRFGPVGDFDGDGVDEIVISSDGGMGLLKLSNGSLTVPVMQQNKAFVGQWQLNAGDQFGPVADLNGDGRAEMVVTSGWGMGILRLDGASMTTVAIYQNGSRLGQWNLDTDNDTLGQAADYHGNGRAEILVTNGWGMAMLKLLPNGVLDTAVIESNGTMRGPWQLDSAADDYGDGR